MENLKDELCHLLYLFFLKIKALLSFVYEIIKHPIKNISIWLVGFLTLLIYKNNYIRNNGQEMLLMSTGLVSIMIFISNFLEKQTSDAENKDNYYLGYNIKKFKFHENFWIKRFSELQVKLLFWIIAIIPIITIYSELKHKFEILNKASEIITTHINYIYSIWLGTFLVSSFYCTALLIESVSISSKNFSNSGFYKITNISEKRKIKSYIEYDFKKIFNNIFNIINILELEKNFHSNVEWVINYIINNGNMVSASDSEILEFYYIAFKCERDKINDLRERIVKYAGCKQDKKIRFKIKNHIFKKIVKLLNSYYCIKWNKISKLDVLPLGIMNVAIQDLNELLEIETNLYQYEEYKVIFWGNSIRNKSNLLNKAKTESNLCISRICEILEEKFRDINFLDQSNDMDKMMQLFDVLNRIDSQTKDNRYFSQIFKILFEHNIDDRCKESSFVKLFHDKMTDNHLPVYLINERNTFSKNILMRGNLITNDILEYLLNFIRLEDIIVVLIFRLAYSERSGRKIMTIDKFKVWENVINKLTVKKDIDDLKKTKFIDELCCEISRSHVSHFIFGQFIKWMWSSLFENFDEKKYEEFIKLGKEGIRRNFSLDSYIIVRLLLCNNPYRLLWIYEIGEENKKQIKTELCSIKDILNIKGVYI